MVADLETFADGSVAYVGARKDAWHRLGTTLPHDLTADDVMNYAKLGGWNVRRSPLFTSTTVNVGGYDIDLTIDVPDQFAVLRDNPVTEKPDVLGVVGKRQTFIQNEEHVAFLDALVDGGARFDTAGSLKNGAQVFVTMKLPEQIMIGGVDPLDINIAAINGHNGSSSFKVLVTPVRIVCANTLTAALDNHSHEYRVRHTANAKMSIAQAREALEMSWTYSNEFALAAERMVNTPITTGQFEKVCEQLFGKREEDAPKQRITKLDTLRGLLDADTQANVKGTRWGAYNAITEYLDHFAPAHKGKAGRDVSRATAALTTAMSVKAEAFDLLAV